MINFLRALFALIMLAMIGITVRASMDRSILDGGAELLDNSWGIATLADAYFGFLTYYVWVAYKERTLPRRLIWFVLIMSLGNIAMPAYALIQLFKVPSDAEIRDVLLREEDR